MNVSSAATVARYQHVLMVSGTRKRRGVLILPTRIFARDMKRSRICLGLTSPPLLDLDVVHRSGILLEIRNEG